MLLISKNINYYLLNNIFLSKKIILKNRNIKDMNVTKNN